MRYVRVVSVISMAIVASLSGCSPRGVFELKVDKIKLDGAQNVADVEKIMGTGRK